MGSVGSRTRSNSTVSLHVRTSRGTDRTRGSTSVSSSTFEVHGAASRPPGSGPQNRMRGRTTARARGARSPVETHRRRRCLVRWRARGPRGPTVDVGERPSTRRCTPTSPAAWTAAIVLRRREERLRKTVVHGHRPHTAGNVREHAAGTGSRVVRGARSRDEREVERKGVLPPPVRPRRVERLRRSRLQPSSASNPAASVRGGPSCPLARAADHAVAPPGATAARSAPAARVRAPSPPDPHAATTAGPSPHRPRRPRRHPRRRAREPCGTSPNAAAVRNASSRSRRVVSLTTRRRAARPGGSGTNVLWDPRTRMIPRASQRVRAAGRPRPTHPRESSPHPRRVGHSTFPKPSNGRLAARLRKPRNGRQAKPRAAALAPGRRRYLARRVPARRASVGSCASASRRTVGIPSRRGDR